jgi:hypothetical protein
MPTKRRRVAHRMIEHPTRPEIMALIEDRPCPPGVDPMFYIAPRNGQVEAAWARHGQEIVERWSRIKPGRRPSCWWLFSAPRLGREFIERWPAWGAWVLTKYHEPRLREGGDGEYLEHFPDVERGFPACWSHVDPEDPPLFESSAAYLKRHGLLLPGERKRLKGGFRPVILPRKLWPH